LLKKFKTEELNKLFLATDNEGITVFNLAILFNSIELFHGTLNFVKENLTTEELNKLLLATNNEGITVFHLAIMFNSIELFQGTLKFVKENLTTG
jgi:ankyrin repeat protein